ncbi:gentisate 1,2-dioxygenase [Sarocladium implicatum]|nr:gentisate 1,2-dioxygenase [Sarocladium implicatum]
MNSSRVIGSKQGYRGSRLNGMVPPTPNPTARAHIWKYDEVLPYLKDAGRLVPEGKAEMRVLMMINPSMKSPHTTDTIYGVNFAEGYSSPRYPSQPSDPSEWRYPWGPVEEALNASEAAWATYEYTQSNDKHLSNILGVRAERLNPGAVGEPQESNSYIYHCYEGTGYTVIEAPSGDKSTFTWGPRDTFAVPAWSKIKHGNESKTDKAYLVACYGGPFLDCLGLRRPKRVRASL